MNTQFLKFISDNYSPGRIVMIGADDFVGKLVREGQSSLTMDGKESKWSHTFILGERRICDDFKDINGSDIFIYESDLDLSFENMSLGNGAMESRLIKWASDEHKVHHACVIEADGISKDEFDKIVYFARTSAYEGENHIKYPLIGLVGILWAIITHTVNKPNIFNEKYTANCCSFVRLCYKHLNIPITQSNVDPQNTADEHIYQFAFKHQGKTKIINEWSKE